MKSGRFPKMRKSRKPGCLISCISAAVATLAASCWLLVPGRVRQPEPSGDYQTFIFSGVPTDQAKVVKSARLLMTRFDFIREIVIAEEHGGKALEVAASIGRCHEENRETRRSPKPFPTRHSGDGGLAVQVFMCLEYDGKWGVCRLKYDPDLDPASVMLFLESRSSSYRVVPRSALPEMVGRVLDGESRARY